MAEQLDSAPHSGDYEGIEFSFAQMRSEIENMLSLSKGFLDQDGLSYHWIIPEWRQQLDNIRDSTHARRHAWEIAETRPIRTRTSEGGYEPSPRHGGSRVFGTLSAKWEVETFGRGPYRTFRLVGLASTKVRIYEVGTTVEPVLLGQWRFEVGDSASPGCHFHIGLGQDRGDPPFPTWFPVPRLPSVLVTPMDGLDFLLGELFQTEWKQEVAQDSDAVKLWATHQRVRLANLLQWQAGEVRRSSGPPWAFLKSSKPGRDLLVGES